MPDSLDPIRSIGSLEQSVLAAVKQFGEHSDVWWRGHSVMGWDLVPKIYRHGHACDEHNFALTFLQSARSRHAKCPDTQDQPSWLFLMQHYGLPTRLLDWSKSALVALYFSVCEPEHDGENGAVWALRPARLNKQVYGGDGMPVAQDPIVQSLCKEAFMQPSDERLVATVGVATDQLDIRHLVQESAFTIHGSEIPLNELPSYEEFLIRYEVSASAKHNLRDMLNRLGINSANLFPDLEHLARQVSEMTFLRPDP